MNITTMHIGIDLGLQAINSNVFGNLLPQAKDYFLNVTTQEFIKLALTDEKNTIFNAVTYADIRSYYEKLQVYIATVELNAKEQLGFGYVYDSLPTGVNLDLLTTGTLQHGIKYKVVVAGTADLRSFGYPTTSLTVGNIFDCVITKQTGAFISIIDGEKYKIINAHGRDFTGLGADNNNPGTIFTATSSSASGGGASTELQNITKSPTWAACSLIAVSDSLYYMNLDSKSTVTLGNVISEGSLTKGKKYIVTEVGTTDLSTVGGVATPDLSYIFACSTSTITPNWDGTTKLYEVKDVVNRLVKAQDVNNFLNHSFGTVITNPISTLTDGKLKVYHNNAFDIHNLYLEYIRKPIEVNSTTLVDSDLPESLHGFLVDLTVKRIAAFSGSPIYSTIDREVDEANK